MNIAPCCLLPVNVHPPDTAGSKACELRDSKWKEVRKSMAPHYQPGPPSNNISDAMKAKLAAQSEAVERTKKRMVEKDCYKFSVGRCANFESLGMRKCPFKHGSLAEAKTIDCCSATGLKCAFHMNPEVCPYASHRVSEAAGPSSA